jgi:hypothetical protein
MTKKYTSFGWFDDEEKLIYHYGVTIDTSKPVTGVVCNNSVEFLVEEFTCGVDLAWEEHCKECQGGCTACRCNHPYGECECCFPLWNKEDWEADSKDHEYDPTGEHDICGPQEHGDMLIGGWVRDNEGKWTPDKGKPYSAIVGDCYTQVVWSKWTKLCALCSPCYPGQGDLDTEGQEDVLCYALPPDLMGGEE